MKVVTGLVQTVLFYSSLWRTVLRNMILMIRYVEAAPSLVVFEVLICLDMGC